MRAHTHVENVRRHERTRSHTFGNTMHDPTDRHPGHEYDMELATGGNMCGSGGCVLVAMAAQVNDGLLTWWGACYKAAHAAPL